MVNIWPDSAKNVCQPNVDPKKHSQKYHGAFMEFAPKILWLEHPSEGWISNQENMPGMVNHQHQRTKVAIKGFFRPN